MSPRSADAGHRDGLARRHRHRAVTGVTGGGGHRDDVGVERSGRLVQAAMPWTCARVKNHCDPGALRPRLGGRSLGDGHAVALVRKGDLTAGAGARMASSISAVEGRRPTGVRTTVAPADSNRRASPSPAANVTTARPSEIAPGRTTRSAR